MNEDKFIKKFCKKPFPISALSHSGNHFYDFLGMLYILLVKNHEKKFHITGGRKRNVLRVANDLKIYCNRLNRPFFLDKYQSKIIDKQILDLLIKTKKNELERLKSDPYGFLKSKTKRWAGIQIVKAFLGIPIIPGK